MRALIILIFIFASFGAQARTLLEKHQQLNLGAGYGRHANLPPPSPSSSPPSKEVSDSVSSSSTPTVDSKTSENSELLMMTTSSDQLLFSSSSANLASFKKMFVSYLLPVSYVWNNLVMTTAPSSNHDDDGYDKSFDERYWRPRPRSPPSPKPSDHQGQTIINSKFVNENNNKNNNNYGRTDGKGKLAPPAPEYDPPIHQVTSNGDGQGLVSHERSLSNPFLAST